METYAAEDFELISPSIVTFLLYALRFSLFFPFDLFSVNGCVFALEASSSQGSDHHGESASSSSQEPSQLWTQTTASTLALTFDSLTKCIVMIKVIDLRRWRLHTPENR